MQTTNRIPDNAQRLVMACPLRGGNTGPIGILPVAGSVTRSGPFGMGRMATSDGESLCLT